MTSRNSIKASTGYWVTRLARTMERDFEKRLEPLGVTRGAYALLSAIHQENKTRPAELATFLGIDGAAVTRHLDRIEKRGLIKRKPNPRDRRATDIELTAEGRRVVLEGQAGSMATNAKFTAGLTETEVNQFETVIRVMLAETDAAISDV